VRVLEEMARFSFRQVEQPKISFAFVIAGIGFLIGLLSRGHISPGLGFLVGLIIGMTIQIVRAFVKGHRSRQSTDFRDEC
jgi:multisubunit Na+/H+ antiporter MnhB subunit